MEPRVVLADVRFGQRIGGGDPVRQQPARVDRFDLVQDHQVAVLLGLAAHFGQHLVRFLDHHEVAHPAALGEVEQREQAEAASPRENSHSSDDSSP